MKCGTVSLWMIVLLSLPQTALADFWGACPQQAFLIQGGFDSELISVDLATGNFATVGSFPGSGRINAIGFNVYDGYIYGFVSDFGHVVRLGVGGWELLPPVVGLPPENFLVGDVHPVNANYYVYDRDAGGLYVIELTGWPALLATQVTDPTIGATARIFDFAFNPLDGHLYSVDIDGALIRIDPSDGAETVLGHVGPTGIFGATYFDVQGHLYVQHNQTGFIYLIDLSGGIEGIPPGGPVAQFLSNGPSGQKDGARCALSPGVFPEEVCDNGLDDDFDGLVDLDDDDCSGVNPPAVPMLPPLGFAALIVLLVAARRRIER